MTHSWDLEVQAVRRALAARRLLAASSPGGTKPPPAAPPPARRQADPVALGIVNTGRIRAGEAPLATLPESGSPQPTTALIDAKQLAAAIVAAGDGARSRA